MKHDSYSKIIFDTPSDFEKYLKEYSDKIPGIWLKMAKKNSGVKTVTYDEALEVALCYGWIDGQAAGFDETYSMVKFTPRGSRSLWSKRNVGIAEDLIKQGKMKKGGLEEIEKAKKDGRWERAYLGSSEAEVPADFIKEIKRDEKSYTFFQTLNKQNLFAIYFRLQTAPNDKVKENRKKVILEKLKKQERFY